MTDITLSAEFSDYLWALPTLAEQLVALRATGLPDAQSLVLLLAETERLVQRAPAKARQLSLLCAQVATIADAPAALARADYLRAQTHAVHGEFEQALDLIQAAHDRYASLNLRLEALRTKVGLMNVLDELGRYQEVLDLGQAVLDQAGAILAEPATPNADEWQAIVARIQLNRGVSLMQLGDYTSALHAYGLAERLFASLQQNEWRANVINNRGMVLTYMGRVGDALAAYEEAARLRAADPPSLPHAHTLINVGEAQRLLGHYADSLVTFQQANQLLLRLDARVDQQINLLHLADAYLALNLYPEALAAYREAEAYLAAANMVYERGLALWGAGAALLAQTQLSQAETVLTAAAALFSELENIPLRCSVLLELAALHGLRHQPARSVELASEALTLLTAGGATNWPVQQIYTHFRLADLVMPAELAAEQHLAAAERLLAPLPLPHLRYRLCQRLGQLRLWQGRDREAQVLLEKALASVEQLRNSLAHETLLTSFLHDKAIAYETLVALHLKRGDQTAIELAFTVAERARARALVDLLAGAVEPQPAAVAGQLARPIRLLQAELNGLYNQLLQPLLAAPDADEPIFDAEALRGQASAIEQQINRLRLQAAGAEAAAPDLTAALSLTAIQAQLPDTIVLLSYYVLEEEILVFVSRQGGLSVLRHLSTAPTVARLLERLNLQWQRFHTSQAFVERHRQLLEQSTQRLLKALYDELMGQVERFLDEQWPVATPTERQLVVAPYGLLHGVPFHALHNGYDYLLERHALSYAPSATAYLLCQQRVPSACHQALVMGVADAHLPAVALETAAVAHQLHRAAYHVEQRENEAATLAALRATAPTCRILHIACHGLFRHDNPMFSALRLHDGWLTAGDALQLQLAGALVTLSACESGRSRVVVGDETVGLVRAFLGAGAATVVVSQWVVQDEAAALLMSTWYAELERCQDKAEALRRAQLATKGRYPHPYYWAPFMLVGQR